jgi:hypothetical protein
MTKKDTSQKRALVSRGSAKRPDDDLPTPSMRFRRKSWLAFQQALDPLAPPKRLPRRPPR